MDDLERDFGDLMNGTGDQADLLNMGGIFGADCAGLCPALSHHDSVQTTNTRAGVVVTMACRACGKPRQITIEWPELVAIKYNIAPQQVFGHNPQRFLANGMTPWNYSLREQAWFPALKCPKCRQLVAPLVSVQEAEMRLQQARATGWIDPRGEQVVAQLCIQFAQQRTAGPPLPPR